MALLRGDFAKLETLRRRAADVASPAFRESLARRLAATATKLLADQFRDSKDPYGRGWLPVYRNRRRERMARKRALAAGNWQKAQRADKPLVDTGRLRAAATASQITHGTTVRVSIPVEYASFHQYGTKRIPQRQIVPMAETGGLGPVWTEAFARETERAFNDANKKGG